MHPLKGSLEILSQAALIYEGKNCVGFFAGNLIDLYIKTSGSRLFSSFVTQDMESRNRKRKKMISCIPKYKMNKQPIYRIDLSFLFLS
jgi:hypothetical protein